MSENDGMLDAAIEELMDSLPFVWGRIRSRLRAAAIQNFGITLEQFHTLRHIRNGFDSVAALSEARQISRPAISQAVDALVKKGLVSRKTDASDRRSVHLEVTPAAQKVLDSNSRQTRLWMKEQMKSLTAPELERIIQTLQTLHQTFNDTKGSDRTNS